MIQRGLSGAGIGGNFELAFFVHGWAYLRGVRLCSPGAARSL
jgi:hypothetical protein